MYEKMAILFVLGALFLVAVVLHFVNTRNEIVIDKLKAALREATSANEVCQDVLVKIDDCIKKTRDQEDKLLLISRILDKSRCKNCGSPGGSRWYKDITSCRDFKDLLCPSCINKKRQF